MFDKIPGKKRVPELEDLAAEWRKLSAAVRGVAKRLDYQLVLLISSLILASLCMFVYLPADIVGGENTAPDNLSLSFDALLRENAIKGKGVGEAKGLFVYCDVMLHVVG